MGIGCYCSCYRAIIFCGVYLYCVPSLEPSGGMRFLEPTKAGLSRAVFFRRSFTLDNHAEVGILHNPPDRRKRRTYKVPYLVSSGGKLVIDADNLWVYYVVICRYLEVVVMSKSNVVRKHPSAFKRIQIRVTDERRQEIDYMSQERLGILPSHFINVCFTLGFEMVKRMVDPRDSVPDHIWMELVKMTGGGEVGK